MPSIIKPLGTGIELISIEEAMREIENLPAPETQKDEDSGGKDAEDIGQPLAAQPPPIIQTAGFSIEEHADRYRIYGVQHNNSMHAVDITKNLLESGASHTQEEWAALTQNKDWQKANGIWQLGSAPLQTAAIATLCTNQNIADAVQKDLVEKVRDMLKKDFITYGMMTSTRIKYTARGKDIVYHDWNYPQQTEIKENIAGPNGFINANCGFDNALNALCGISPAIAEQAYEYISGRKPYLWRINSKSAQDIERALVLYAGSGRFYMSAGVIGDGRPARGWSASRAQKSP